MRGGSEDFLCSSRRRCGRQAFPGTFLAQVWAFLRLHPFGSAVGRAALAALTCYGVVGLVVRFTLGGSIRTLILYEVVAGALYLLLLIRFRVPLQTAAFGQALRRR